MIILTVQNSESCVLTSPENYQELVSRIFDSGRLPEVISKEKGDVFLYEGGKYYKLRGA